LRLHVEAIGDYDDGRSNYDRLKEETSQQERREKEKWDYETQM
jgi:hypothetical protein